MRQIIIVSAAFLAVGFSIAWAQASEQRLGNAERGASLYQSRCGACHSLDANRIGPRHRDVYGRTAGSVAEYNYSKALRASSVIWDRTTLNHWLTDPQSLIPGQKMGFRLSRASERADIIAYLERESKEAK